MDAKTRQAVMDEIFPENKKECVVDEISARLTFYEDFTCIVNNDRIEVTYTGHGQQRFLFAHPNGPRQYFIESRQTIITLRNVIQQTLDNGQYTNRHTLNLRLEFLPADDFIRFRDAIVGQNYVVYLGCPSIAQ